MDCPQLWRQYRLHVLGPSLVDSMQKQAGSHVHQPSRSPGWFVRSCRMWKNCCGISVVCRGKSRHRTATQTMRIVRICMGVCWKHNLVCLLASEGLLRCSGAGRARDNRWPLLPQDRFSSLSSLPYCCAQNSSCSFNSDGSCSCLAGESVVRQYVTCLKNMCK